MHTVLIVSLGINILDAFDLEALAESAAKLEAMGIHVDHCADSRDRWNRGTAERAGHFLIEQSALGHMSQGPPYAR